MVDENRKKKVIEVEGRGRWWERAGKEGDRCGWKRKVVGENRKKKVVGVEGRGRWWERLGKRR